MTLAFIYTESQPLEAEATYPYKAVGGTCQYKEGSGLVGASTFTNILPFDNVSLKAAVAITPVSIAIEADQTVFQGYTGGVLNSAACGIALDHGVAIVGYGNEAGQDYWIVRNSWGAVWGEAGYIRIADVAGSGICGINLQAVYPAAN